MARFRFPANPHSSLLINAGGSAQPDDFAAVQRRPGAAGDLRRGIERQLLRAAAALPDLFRGGLRPPLRRLRDLGRGAAEAGVRAAEDSQAPATNPRSSAQAGAFASFDTRKRRTVGVRVGLSFVSVEGARANLAAESSDAGFGELASRAERRWNQALGRIRVSGGPEHLLDTFYTALYHAFLAPRTFNDVDGRYLGMDGAVHRARGRTQYADFSGWDTYRTQIQLLSC